MPEEKTINQFNQDAIANQGYLYAASDKLSCRLANKRLSDAVFAAVEISGKRVIDIGCGDGQYTLELLTGKPQYILGVDAAEAAVELASNRAQNLPDIDFKVGDIYNLASLNDHFDIAIVRGVLHHLDDAAKAIQSLMEVAEQVVVVEPNGYNPGLKIIEKLSRYHIEHGEKSYFPCTINKWFAIAGGQLIYYSYCGLVPMFCPDWLARFLKTIEPLVEHFPGLRKLGCAVYVIRVNKVLVD